MFKSMTENVTDCGAILEIVAQKLKKCKGSTTTALKCTVQGAWKHELYRLLDAAAHAPFSVR